MLLTKENVSLSPNPASSSINVEFSEISSELNIELNIIEISGKKVYSEKFVVVDGNYVRKVNVSSLSSGNFLVLIKTGQNVVSLDLVKE
jgi:hypothetical protein